MAEPSTQKSEPQPEPAPAPEPTPEPQPDSKEEPIEPEVEEPKVEPPPSPAPEPEPLTEPKAPEPDEKEKTIADLRNKIAELESKRPESPKEEPKSEPPKVTEQDFVKDLDLDDLTRDSAELNKAMNRIYQQAVVDAQKSFGEQMTKSLPDIIRQNVEMIENMKAARESFYAENEDLKPFNKVVATVFEELAAKSPDKTYADVIKEVAPEVRKRLELPQQATKGSQPTRSGPPPLPKISSKAGRPSTKPSVDPLQAELEEMNKILGR